jgi:agmatine deiminase
MMQTEPPVAQGYRWPAEWEPHAATWVSWPHNPSTWPGKFEPVPGQFAQLVRTLARFEPVHVLAGGDGVRAAAEQHLGDLRGVTLHGIPTNDAWCRDHGPIFLCGCREPGLAVVDCAYNAWGGKYPPFDLDNQVPGRIAAKLGCPRFATQLVLEGGAIDGNGRGLALATRPCLLHANRNPGIQQADMERFLQDYLGITRVLWLERGELAGDDTDGHVDQLARFVAADTIVAAWETDSRDENYDSLQENFRQLQAMVDDRGRRFQVEPLRMPRPRYHAGQRLPASYCNFYIANRVVLVPQFDDPQDAAAVQTLARLFPERQVIGLPALDLVWGLGAFHCLTQQQPACRDSSTPTAAASDKQRS